MSAISRGVGKVLKIEIRQPSFDGSWNKVHIDKSTGELLMLLTSYNWTEIGFKRNGPFYMAWKRRKHKCSVFGTVYYRTIFFRFSVNSKTFGNYPQEIKIEVLTFFES